MSQFDFVANRSDGLGIDWPIRYRDLAPWYEYVERFVGISGSYENLPQLPDSLFQPPFEMTLPERDFVRKMARLEPDKPVIISRCAHLTQPNEIQVELGRMSVSQEMSARKAVHWELTFSHAERHVTCGCKNWKPIHCSE